MNFLSSITSKVYNYNNQFTLLKKTTGVLNSYKSEFGTFIQCLKSDLTEVLDKDSHHDYKYQSLGQDQSNLSTNNSKNKMFEKNQNIIKFEKKEILKTNSEKNVQILREILKNFIDLSELQKLDNEKIEQILERIEAQQQNFNKDPNDLIMLDREDFTNFSVFFEQYSENQLIIQKLEEYDQTLKIRCEYYYNQEQSNENSEQLNDIVYKKMLLRYFYRIIYYINDLLQNKTEYQPNPQFEQIQENKIIIEESNEPKLINEIQKEEKKEEENEEEKVAQPQDHKNSWDIEEKFI